MRLTATAPEALRDACNHLAMCLAYGPADALTYGEPKWQDADGNLYAAASFVARDEWVQGASSPLQRPAWDTDSLIDMDAAQLAQAALVVWLEGDDPDNPAPIPQASPDKLTVVAGDDGLAALAAMGLRLKADLAET